MVPALNDLDVLVAVHSTVNSGRRDKSLVRLGPFFPSKKWERPQKAMHESHVRVLRVRFIGPPIMT